MVELIILGNNIDVLKSYPDNSVDSVVTDPPYGLSKEPNIVEVLSKWLAGEPYTHKSAGFMGNAWDAFVPHPDLWREVFRVLKPGGHALVFAGTRTQDLMTIALRLGGFEIRDVIEWLYFSGFPKSMDVSKAFDKAAGAERETLAVKHRKAFGYNDTYRPWKHAADADLHRITAPTSDLAKCWDGWGTALKPAHEPIIVARKPVVGTVISTVEKHGTGAMNINGCRIGRIVDDRTDYGVDGDEQSHTGDQKGNAYGVYGRVAYTPHAAGRFPTNCVTLEDNEFYSPYFNVSPAPVSRKASKKDRGEGNTHPTVKPTDLMAWLVRLVTPPGGTVLDPFAGSGSTLVAAKQEGFEFVGIEMQAEYVEVAKRRTAVIQPQFNL